MDTFHRITLSIIHELWLKPVTSHADTVTLSILPVKNPHQTPSKKQTQQMCRRSGDAEMDIFYTFTGPQNHMSISTYESRKLRGLSRFHTESGICFPCIFICLRVCGFWPSRFLTHTLRHKAVNIDWLDYCTITKYWLMMKRICDEVIRMQSKKRAIINLGSYQAVRPSAKTESQFQVKTSKVVWKEKTNSLVCLFHLKHTPSSSVE